MFYGLLERSRVLGLVRGVRWISMEFDKLVLLFPKFISGKYPKVFWKVYRVA